MPIFIINKTDVKLMYYRLAESSRMVTEETDIKVETIKMQPVIMVDNKSQRSPLINTASAKMLVMQEAFLRKSAYKNTTLKTGESFFDDSDLNADYFLVVAYDKNSNTPLLSSRYYFDKSVIARCLKGDEDPETKHTGSTISIDLNNYADGQLFLADRLSGNIFNSIYRQNRNSIVTLFYSEIITKNKDCTLILMARKEKQDKLLKKYLSLRFTIAGSVMHKTRAHWIVIADLKNAK